MVLKGTLQVDSFLLREMSDVGGSQFDLSEQRLWALNVREALTSLLLRPLLVFALS